MPDFQPTITLTSNSATVSFPESGVVRVEGGSFSVVGTATRVSDNTMVTSDSATYPDSAEFRNLKSNTSYNFVIQIVSQATDGIMIGSFSGSFTTMASSCEFHFVCMAIKGIDKFVRVGMRCKCKACFF